MSIEIMTVIRGHVLSCGPCRPWASRRDAAARL